jgi:hypothetical protein
MKVSVGKPEGRRPLKRLRQIWKNNIKIDIKVIRWHGEHRIDPAQDRDW